MGSDGGRSVGSLPLDWGTSLAVALGYIAGVLLLLFVSVDRLGLEGETVLAFAIIGPLVPFLLYLAHTGRLQRVTAGNFELLFNEVVRSEITPTPMEVEVIEIPIEQREAPIRSYLDEVQGDIHRPVLNFILGERVDAEVIDGYLQRMPKLDFVVFTDTVGQFEGLMTAADFRSVYLTTPARLIDRIETGSVLELAEVVQTTVGPETTNAIALTEMAHADVDMLGVVESSGEFVGVLSQTAIERGLLIDLFSRSER